MKEVLFRLTVKDKQTLKVRIESESYSTLLILQIFSLAQKTLKPVIRRFKAEFKKSLLKDFFLQITV